MKQFFVVTRLRRKGQVSRSLFQTVSGHFYFLLFPFLLFSVYLPFGCRCTLSTSSSSSTSTSIAFVLFCIYCSISLSPLSPTFHSFSQSARMSSSSAVCVHLGEDKAAANFDCQWHCHHHQNLRQSRECTVCLTLSSVVVVVVVENVCSRRAEMCSGKREVFRFFFCSVQCSESGQRTRVGGERAV